MHRFVRILLALLGMAVSSRSQPLRVVCFGDSTTAPRKGVETYCDMLRASGIDAVNRGVPGNTTEMARVRFSSDVLAAHPDVVVIQFGLNDSTVDVWKTPPAAGPRVAVSRYAGNLAWFVESLRAVNCRSVLVTFNPLVWTGKLRSLYGRPPYRPDKPDGFDIGRREYLEAIRSVAARTGAVLVDLNAACRDYASRSGRHLEDLLSDGMHPNTRGHRLEADLLLSVLRR